MDGTWTEVSRNSMADSNEKIRQDDDSISAVVTGINQLIFEANQKGVVVFGEYVVKMFCLEEEPMTLDDLKKYPVRLWLPKGIYDRKGGNLIETVENMEAVDRFLASMRQVGTLTLIEMTKDYTEYRYLEHRVLMYNSVNFPAVLLDVFRVMARFRWSDFRYTEPDLYCNPYMVRSLLGAITDEQSDQEQIDRIRFNRKIIKMEATIEPTFTIDRTNIETLIEMTRTGWQIKCNNEIEFKHLLTGDPDPDALIAILHQSQRSHSQIKSEPEEQPLIYHYRMAMQLYQQISSDALPVILELLQGRYGKF